jgi:hypothetical protein
MIEACVAGSEAHEATNFDSLSRAKGANHAVEDRFQDYLGIVPADFDDSRHFFEQPGLVI